MPIRLAQQPRRRFAAAATLGILAVGAILTSSARAGHQHSQAASAPAGVFGWDTVPAGQPAPAGVFGWDTVPAGQPAPAGVYGWDTA